MNDAVPMFRVSSKYLWNLCQQAISVAFGILSGWALFLVFSLWFFPIETSEQLAGLPGRLFDNLVSSSSISTLDFPELLRFALGPALALCVVPGVLGDISSWAAVRYEIHPGFLRMRWRRLIRDVEWELIQIIDERPNRKTECRGLKVAQFGRAPILVRGLANLPEFIEALRTRVPRQTRWTTETVRIDLTSSLTNFTIGFLLPLPLYATWIAYYVWQWHATELVWALVLLLGAVWIWFRKPMTRAQMCIREVEVTMAILVLILSGVLTVTGWFESPTAFSIAVFRWLGW